MPCRRDRFEHRRFVAQIHLLEHILRVLRHIGEIVRMPGVSQAIQVDQPPNFRPVDDMVDQSSSR